MEMQRTIDIVPECNLGIEKCRNGTKERNAPFLCSETDYVLTLQAVDLPYPRQLFRHMNNGNNAAIIRM